jgi:hypothetical protein
LNQDELHAVLLTLPKNFLPARQKSSAAKNKHLPKEQIFKKAGKTFKYLPITSENLAV